MQRYLVNILSNFILKAAVENIKISSVEKWLHNIEQSLEIQRIN